MSKRSVVESNCLVARQDGFSAVCDLWCTLNAQTSLHMYLSEQECAAHGPLCFHGRGLHLGTARNVMDATSSQDPLAVPADRCHFPCMIV